MYWKVPTSIKGVIAFMTGCWLLFVAALLTSCVDEPDPDEPVVTMACVRSFADVLAEWNVYATERVPAKCEHLDSDYDVQLVGAEEMPPQCADDGPGTQVVGCTVGHVIYLLQGRDQIATVDTSVHEWVHALSACVYGDPDVDHNRSGLWEKYKPDSVETRAQAAAVTGECL